MMRLRYCLPFIVLTTIHTLYPMKRPFDNVSSMALVNIVNKGLPLLKGPEQYIWYFYNKYKQLLPYACKLCYFMGSNNADLDAHKKAFHPFIHMCYLCQAIYTFPHLLKLHMQEVHHDGDIHSLAVRIRPITPNSSKYRGPASPHDQHKSKSLAVTEPALQHLETPLLRSLKKTIQQPIPIQEKISDIPHKNNTVTNLNDIQEKLLSLIKQEQQAIGQSQKLTFIDATQGIDALTNKNKSTHKCPCRYNCGKTFVRTSNKTRHENVCFKKDTGRSLQQLLPPNPQEQHHSQDLKDITFTDATQQVIDTHTNEGKSIKKYICHYCPRQFIRTSDRTRHENNAHKNENG